MSFTDGDYGTFYDNNYVECMGRWDNPSDLVITFNYDAKVPKRLYNNLKKCGTLINEETLPLVLKYDDKISKYDIIPSYLANRKIILKYKHCILDLFAIEDSTWFYDFQDFYGIIVFKGVVDNELVTIRYQSE